MILSYVASNTMEYLAKMPKKDRKKRGQFFTGQSTAKYMASLFIVPNKGKISVLDPGAGTGILSAALVERIFDEMDQVSVSLTCYETDRSVLPVLKKNLQYMKAVYGDRLEVILAEGDYLISQADNFCDNIFADKDIVQWDVVISNPPYSKVERNSPAAQAMSTVVHGAPNLYFLFMAMALFNLKSNGEMVFIIPRSWTSGAYFKAFRDYLLDKGKITYIHLFDSRDRVFNEEQVLQETMIIKIKKTSEVPDTVTIASSESSVDFTDIGFIKQPYGSVVVGKDNYVFLPISNDEVTVIETVNMYNKTMPDYGYKMKTGIVVDFRQKYALKEKRSETTVPLFYSQHIHDGNVSHEPSGKIYDWLVTDYPGLIQQNKDYVFFKRFTAKEEKRRLQCGIYQADNFREYKYIGTHNKMNFIERIDKEPFSKQEIYGIYALFNSTLFDKYYRILDGSTQVNSTEVNSMPVPPMNIVCRIGERLLQAETLDTSVCDSIVMEIAYGKEN